MARVVYVDTQAVPWLEDISIGAHKLQGDEPGEAGGADAGPSPYEFLLAALGTCTCITVRMYAQTKHWPLEAVHISLTHSKIHADDSVASATEVRMLDKIVMAISLIGDLSEDQQRRLLDVAARCPVHRTLTATIQIETTSTPSEAS
jgi:putative redox protein